jgi:hypothetical protein
MKPKTIVLATIAMIACGFLLGEILQGRFLQ